MAQFEFDINFVGGGRMVVKSASPDEQDAVDKMDVRYKDLKIASIVRQTRIGKLIDRNHVLKEL